MTEQKVELDVRRKTVPPIDDSLFKVLILVTGSVAAIKLKEIVETLLSYNESNCDETIHKKFSIIVALTNAGKHFVVSDLAQIEKLGVPCFTDDDEWSVWMKRGDPVTHIDLRKWADLLLIAPLDANTLAKISNGQCDNLVTCVCRAWDIGSKPWLVAPAMNTLMWSHPFTAKQLNILRNDLQVVVIDPMSKQLMCGDTGVGAMASVESICKLVLKHNCSHKS